MKRLNRKGFTLIELVAVIAVLVVIMGIALPNITSSIERSKQKQKESKIKLIVSAGELYFDRYKTKDKTKGVKIETLISENFITNSETEDTCTYYGGSDTCCVTYNSTTGNYEYNEEASQDCFYEGY